MPKSRESSNKHSHMTKTDLLARLTELEARLRTYEQGPVRHDDGPAGAVADTDENQQAQEAIRERMAVVELLHKSATAANQAQNVDEAMRSCIDAVCAHKGWPVGHVYVCSKESPDVLVPTDIWHLDDPERFATFRRVTQETSFERGIGLPGRVMASGEPAWIVDVTKDPNFPRAKLAEDIGVRAGFAIPVVVGEQVEAVLEFFASETLEPDRALLQVLDNVAVQIGRVFERQRMEATLREKQQRLERMLENSPIGVCIADSPNLQIIFSNEKMADQLGATKAELITMRTPELYGDPTVRKPLLREYEKSGEVRDAEVMLKRRDGSTFWSLLSLFPIEWGPIEARIGWFYDITHLKETEKALRTAKEQAEEAQEKAQAALNELYRAQQDLIQSEKMASLGRLTAGIAHEIMNPLNFVNNFAEISVELLGELNDITAMARPVLSQDDQVELDDLLEKLSQNLSWINEHGNRADSIVKNMLLHTRGDPAERRDVDINALLEESLKLAYHGARAKDKSFNVELERSFDANAGAIRAAPQEIGRVFLNIIGNGFYAVDRQERSASRAGFKPLLKVTTRDLGQAVEVQVRDNGTGIAKENLDRIFDPFFSTKPTGEGTGLGLSLSHDIVVSQYGGSIEVSSTPGEFTEFTITLPRHGPVDAAETPGID